MHERGAEAQALLTNLDNDIKELEARLRKDELSLRDMDENLRVAQLEGKRLRGRIFEEEKMIQAMSPTEGLGSAIKQFDNSMTAVKATYKHLRGRHADAIGILKTEFGYNPGFKKGQAGGGEFSAAYHTMAKDPSKLHPKSER